MDQKDSKAQMQILEPSAAGGGWQLSERPYSVEALASLPKQCYIFLHKDHYKPTDGRRERLLAHFNAPKFVATETCYEVNGYFGSKAKYGGRRLANFSTWFRCLVKMVHKIGTKPHEAAPHDNGPEYATAEKGYRWFEMSFFSRWDDSVTSQILCVDTPFDFPDELQKLLEKQDQPLNFLDPFAMHASLVDQIIVYADISVWRVRDPVRLLEKRRMRLGAIFGPIHEMSRHAIHTTEVLEASIDTLSEMHQRRTAVYERMSNDLDETYRDQATDYGQFQLSLFKSLKLRSQSNQERLKDEIGLAFNNLARQDNDVMKSIALLTMIFLPATFISAIFSTTFFNFNDEGEWVVSDKQWIYWATIVPATIAVVGLWQAWVSSSDAISQFINTILKWFTGLWTKDSTQRKKQNKGEEAGEPRKVQLVGKIETR